VSGQEPNEVITPDEVDAAMAEMTALVDKRLPERFYPSEDLRRVLLTALISRMAGLVESMRQLVQPERQVDNHILLRALYEHLVMFLWLAIDPAPRVHEWHGHTMVHRRTLHLDAVRFGADGVLSPEALAQAEGFEKLHPLEQRAAEVDQYWGPRIKGFFTDLPGQPREIRTPQRLVCSDLPTRQSSGARARRDPRRGNRIDRQRTVDRGSGAAAGPPLVRTCGASVLDGISGRLRATRVARR
jgi:hypothetical protein